MKKDLKEIQIQIPSPLKGSKPINISATPINKTSSKIKKENVLHQESYYYLNKTGSVINLITNDFKLICLPDNLIPLHVKPGAKLSLTIEEMDNSQLKNQAQQIFSMQEEFRKNKGAK